MNLVQYIHPGKQTIVAIDADSQDHLSRMEKAGYVPLHVFTKPAEPVPPPPPEPEVLPIEIATPDEVLSLIDIPNRDDGVSPVTPIYDKVEPELFPVIETKNQLPLESSEMTWESLAEKNVSSLRAIAKKMGIKVPNPPHKDSFIRAILDRCEGRS